MPDGRVYTLQDELDVLREDHAKAVRALESLERAPHEGRCVTGEAGIVWGDHVHAQRARIAYLEREIAAVEDKLAAEENER